MKRPATTNAAANAGTAKESELLPAAAPLAAAPLPPAAPLEAASKWAKADNGQESPAPPPVWTRYIDSRLKQFCTR